MSKSKKNASKSESKSQRKAAGVETPTTPIDPDRVPLTEVMKKPEGKAKKAKAPKVAKEPKPAKPAKEKKPSGLDAAFQVLSHTGEPMRCKDMVDKMLSTGLWKTEGKTPSATIYSAILREITVKGSDSRFKKTDRGLFTINNHHAN